MLHWSPTHLFIPSYLPIHTEHLLISALQLVPKLSVPIPQELTSIFLFDARLFEGHLAS